MLWFRRREQSSLHAEYNPTSAETTDSCLLSNYSRIFTATRFFPGLTNVAVMPPSTRRAILRLGTATFGVTVAGCLSASEPAQTDTESQPTASDSVQCGEGGTVSLEAASDEFIVVTGDNVVEALVITLRNETTCSVEFNTGAWHIERRAADGWHTVARGNPDEGDHRTITSGDEHAWSLSLSPHPTSSTETTTFITTELAAGTYVLVVAGTLDNGEQLTLRAHFDLTKRTPSATSTRTRTDHTSDTR